MSTHTVADLRRNPLGLNRKPSVNLTLKPSLLPFLAVMTAVNRRMLQSVELSGPTVDNNLCLVAARLAPLRALILASCDALAAVACALVDLAFPAISNSVPLISAYIRSGIQRSYSLSDRQSVI